MEIGKYTLEEIIDFAKKHLKTKENLKKYMKTYRKTIKGRDATRKSSLKYYHKTKKIKKKTKTKV